MIHHKGHKVLTKDTKGQSNPLCLCGAFVSFVVFSLYYRPESGESKREMTDDGMTNDK